MRALTGGRARAFCWPLVLGSIAALFGCAATTGPVKPRPETEGKLKVVPATDAATAFQAEADAIKARGEPVDWGDVEGRMTRITTSHPTYGLAWFNLGLARENVGRLEEAAEAYRKAIATNGELREARENLAALAARQGDLREAVALLKELVASDPGAAEARVALASYELQSGDPEAARRLAIEALTHDPKNLGAYCVLGKDAYGAKDGLRVRLLAAQGLKIDAQAACLHDLLGRVALDEGDPGLALKHFEEAVKADPALVEANFAIGEISLAYRDYNRAVAAFEAVTQARPDEPAGLVNLGIAKKAAGRLEEAEQAYLAAIAQADGAPVPAAHFNLGILYLRHLDRLDDAERALKTYLQTSDGEGDQVFAWLEEIAVRRQMAEEERQRAEEEARQAEIERMRAEEEAREKAALEAKIAANRARARAEGEPEDPALPEATEKEDTKEAEVDRSPPARPSPARERPERRRTPRRARPEAAPEPEPVDPPSDFE